MQCGGAAMLAAAMANGWWVTGGGGWLTFSTAQQQQCANGAAEGGWMQCLPVTQMSWNSWFHWLPGLRPIGLVVMDDIRSVVLSDG